MFLLDAPLPGESILLLLGRELPIRTLETFIFGEKGGVHSTVLFRSVFEANAWEKVPIPLLYAPQLPNPLQPALPGFAYFNSNSLNSVDKSRTVLS